MKNNFESKTENLFFFDTVRPTFEKTIEIGTFKFLKMQRFMLIKKT